MCFFSVKIAYYTRRREKFTEKQLCQHLIPRNFSVRQIKITGGKQSLCFFFRKPSKIDDTLRSKNCLSSKIDDTLRSKTRRPPYRQDAGSGGLLAFFHYISKETGVRPLSPCCFSRSFQQMNEFLNYGAWIQRIEQTGLQ